MASIAWVETKARAARELADESVVKRVLEGERELYEILMRRHNQRVYRIARSILRDENEAEDVMQDAYVRAYAHLEQFEGRAKFATWLGKIAVHEALARLRRRGRIVEWEENMSNEGNTTAKAPATPEEELSRSELHGILTKAIDAIPAPLRLVFVLRQVEEWSTEETAECVGISQENVKVRLHRARAALRDEIDRRVGRHAPDLYSFHLSRCDRVVRGVFARLVCG